MSWADAAAPIVAQVIHQVGRTDMRVLRKALVAAYPWGERENARYKAWLAEIRRQLGASASSRGSLMARAKSKPISPDNPQERIEEHPAGAIGC